MLISRPVKRFFAFGCSFTNYYWAMWPEVVKQELGDVEFYNNGLVGAGNLFIAHQIYDANEVYQFDEHDLIMVCWSSVYRNDWFIDDKWLLEGNMYYPGLRNGMLPDSLKDINHHVIRDASVITGVCKFLESLPSQSHQLCMVNNFLPLDQDDGDIPEDILNHPECKPLVEYCRDIIKPSFWDMGYDLEFKQDYWENTIGIREFCRDDHPLPIWSMEYLSKVLNHDFTQETQSVVNAYHEKVCELFVKHQDTEDCHFYKVILEHYPRLAEPNMSLVNFLN